jgi:hypothetical protein
MDKEKLAEQLHIWYLEATHTIPSNAYNMKAQVDYDELSEDQKHIDRYIASAILKLFKQEMLEMIRENRESLAQLIHKHLFNADMTENSPVRNLHIYALVDDLRAELRKKVEVDNG